MFSGRWCAPRFLLPLPLPLGQVGASHAKEKKGGQGAFARTIEVCKRLLSRDLSIHPDLLASKLRRRLGSGFGDLLDGVAIYGANRPYI